MKNKESMIIRACCFSLVLLFVYTASSKLLDFQNFQGQMYNQAFPHLMATVLIWLIPLTEFAVAGFLAAKVTRLAGLYGSFVLMALFTSYTALVLFHVFSRTPCSCGGVLKIMGWKLHLIFNIFFLLLSAIGIYFENRERRRTGDL